MRKQLGRGEIDEQQIVVLTRGDVGAKDVRYARRKLARMTSQVLEPIMFARIKLTTAGDPARERPAMAQAELDINGETVRAHVAARVLTEAVDLLEERLREQLEMRRDRRVARRKRTTPVHQPGRWRHGDLPAHRPPYYPRPPEECEVVRHKAYDLYGLTPAQAHEDMLRLDYDFHLFTDNLTGEDSVVFRLPEGGLGLMSLSEPQPAPELDQDQAVSRLHLTGDPFLFYRDPRTGRGAVLYRRYDGHYGLITATAAVPARGASGPPARR
jgi:ribosome-associated translation inhibitor RaiA